MDPHPLRSTAGRHYRDGPLGLAVNSPCAGGLAVRWRDSGAQAVAIRRDALPDGLAEVLKDMKPVRGAERGALGVSARTVPADHFYSWVCLQPGRKRCGFASGQDIDGLVPFAVRDHGGVRVAAAGGEVVDPKDPRRVELRVRQGHYPAQEHHPPGAEAQLGRQPRVGPSCQCEPDTLQDAVEPGGETRVRAGQPREGLDERASKTGPRVTDEAPDLQPDHDTPLAEREIPESALTGAVHSLRTVAAVRAGRTGLAASGHDLNRPEGGRYLLDVHLVDPVEHERFPERCVGLRERDRH